MGGVPGARGAHATDDRSRAVLEAKLVVPNLLQGTTPRHFRRGLQRRRLCAENVTDSDGD